MGARDCTDMCRSLPKEHLEGDCCTSVSLNQWAQGSSPWRCTTTKSELFPIGEGFGFFVFFGNENKGSSLTAVCPKPYQKKDRVTKVTTVKVP